jgi:ribonuclease E
MVLESNRELVLRRLLECLSRDRTKHQVAEVTSLGLVQMTRKRVGAGLLEAFSTQCECCNGRGVILTFDPDADGHATQHTHSRGHGNGGHGNGGHGNGGHGNGGRGPTPAMVAARARSAESSAQAEPSASAPADTPPADAAGAPAAAAAAASALVPASADSADPNAAQVANGQVPDTEPAPARSSGRRRRRKPAAATAPVTPADAPASPAGTPATQADTPVGQADTPVGQADTPAATTAAPVNPGTPAASDSSSVPVTSGAPEPPRPEPSAEITPAEGGALGGVE